MPHTRESWQQQTCKGTTVARDILEPKPSAGPCLSAIQPTLSCFLVARVPEVQVSYAALLTWPPSRWKHSALCRGTGFRHWLQTLVAGNRFNQVFYFKANFTNYRSDVLVTLQPCLRTCAIFPLFNSPVAFSNKDDVMGQFSRLSTWLPGKRESRLKNWLRQIGLWHLLLESPVLASPSDWR